MKKYTTHPIAWALLFLLDFQGIAYAQKNFTPTPNDAASTQNVFFSGQVFCPKGMPMKNVEILLRGVLNDQLEDIIIADTTDENGFYSFEAALFAPPLKTKIQAFFHDSPTNGVTIEDVNKIATHILGLAPFNSPLLLIAADVNQSGTVTSFDANELAKLVNGEILTFTNNTSWRFIKTDVLAPNPGNPFLNPGLDPYEVPDTVTTFTANFWGVKVGDVDSTAVLPECTVTTNEQSIFGAPDQQPMAILHPAVPNPWQETTVFRFDLPRSGTATLRFFDATGRLVYEHQTAGVKGTNTFNIFENAAFLPGLYIFSLEFEGRFFVQKTIKF